MNRLKFFISTLFFFFSFSADAQEKVEMADTMRSEGKIYVVVAIILIVLAGFIIYLLSQDRKLNKLEKLLESRTKSK